MGRLMERFRCDHLTFKNLDRRDFDFQLMPKLFQRLIFEVQGGGGVHELLVELTGG